MLPDFDQALDWVFSDIFRLPTGVIASIAFIRWVFSIVSETQKLGEAIGSLSSIALKRLPSLAILLLGHALLTVATGILAYLLANAYVDDSTAQRIGLWVTWGTVIYLLIVDWFSLTYGDSVPNLLLLIGVYASLAIFFSAMVPMLTERREDSEVWLQVGGWLIVAVLWWRLFVWASGAAFEMAVRARAAV